MALSSQIFYLLLMGAMTRGSLFLDRDSLFHQLHIRFPGVGVLLSAAALFGRGFRRYTSIWVAVWSGFLWLLAGFAFLLVRCKGVCSVHECSANAELFY
jgi:hypothetical protein